MTSPHPGPSLDSSRDPSSFPQDPEKAAFHEAMRTSAPAMPGIFAWGVVAGMAMMQSGLTLWQALGMTLVVFAGSAQLAALPLMAANAPAMVVFLTGLVVNLRFVIFAASMGPHFAHLPWHRRLWYGYLNNDIMMGFFPQRFPGHTLGHTSGKAGLFRRHLLYELAGLAGRLGARHPGRQPGAGRLGRRLRRHAGAAGGDDPAGRRRGGAGRRGGRRRGGCRC